MKKGKLLSTIKLHCFFVWVAALVLSLACGYYVNQQSVKAEQLKAFYTAELTASRVEAQLRRYFEVGDFLKRLWNQAMKSAVRIMSRGLSAYRIILR